MTKKYAMQSRLFHLTAPLAAFICICYCVNWQSYQQITDTHWQVSVSPSLLLRTYTSEGTKFWLQYMVHSVCMCNSSKCITDVERLYINRYNTSLAQLSCCLWTMFVSNDLQNLQDVFWFEEYAGNFIWREFCWNSQSQWISRVLSSKIIQKATWI